MAFTSQELQAGFLVGDCLIEPLKNRIVRCGTEARVEPRVMDVLVCLAEHAGDVVRARAALQTVQDQQERRSRGRRPRDPVEVDEVTVAGVDPLAPKRQAAAVAEERAPHRLQVTVRAPPGGAVRYSCPCSSSFATWGAISRARCSSSASVRFAIGCGIDRNR